jgi:glycogen(starch) synthase
MRIWILTSEYTADTAGGIARYVENFARVAAADGHDVTVLGRSGRDFDERPQPGLRLIGFEPRFRHMSAAFPAGGEADAHPAYPYNVIGYAPALSYEVAQRVLAMLATEEPPDVIECEEFAALPYYLIQHKLIERGRLDGVPIVVHMHSPTFELHKINQSAGYEFPAYWTGQMEKFCLVAADARLCPSRFLARTVQDRFVSPLAITTISLPFMGEFEQPLRDVARDELVYVGRLEMRKGVTRLVAACSRLWAEGARFRLTLIGGDTAFPAKNTTVGAMLRGRYGRWIDAGLLSLVGQVPHGEIKHRLRSAWAALIPSLWENFPNTCIEAMAAGQLTIGSLQGGQAEMIEQDGANGLLFDSERRGDLENAIRRALAFSPDERYAIAARGVERIRSVCAPQVVLPQRIEHFESVRRNTAARPVFPTTWQTPDEVAARLRRSAQAAGPSGRCAPRDSEQPGLVSIVIPYFNLGAYIDDALASAAASTYRPIEILIVDDGSTDPASIAKLSEIEGRSEPNVRVVRQMNEGLPGARNTGAREARGEFLAMLDADDLFEPEYVARAVAILNRYPNVGFVSAWVRYFEGGTGMWPTWNAEPPYMLAHNMTGTLVVTRRRAFAEVGGNDPAFEYGYEDFGAWVAFAAAGWAGVSIPAPLVRYRVRGDSMLRGINPVQSLYLYDVLQSAFPELFRRFGAELFALQNANGPARLWNHPAVAASPPPDPAMEALREWVVKVEAGRDWSERGRLAALERVARLETELAAQRASRGLLPLRRERTENLNGSAEHELERLENSRAWRTLERVKSSTVYRAVARARWGADWAQTPGQETAAERLSRLRASKSYRAIQAAKRTWVYRLYARMRYGGSTRADNQS